MLFCSLDDDKEKSITREEKYGIIFVRLKEVWRFEKAEINWNGWRNKKISNVSNN